MCACPRVNACCRCDARLSDGMCADVACREGVSSLVPRHARAVRETFAVPAGHKRIDARSSLYRGERTVLEWRPVESHCNPRTLKISVFLAAPTRHTTTRETRDGVAAARRRCRRGKGRHAAPQSGTPQRRCPFPVCPRPATLFRGARVQVCISRVAAPLAHRACCLTSSTLATYSGQSPMDRWGSGWSDPLYTVSTAGWEPLVESAKPKAEWSTLSSSPVARVHQQQLVAAKEICHTHVSRHHTATNESCSAGSTPVECPVSLVHNHWCTLASPCNWVPSASCGRKDARVHRAKQPTSPSAYER